jgi:hypothetical protein
MSYDESDLAEDLQWDYFYKEIAPQAIEDFVAERMTSYYDAHRDIAVPAAGLLEEAIALCGHHPRAAVVFAVAAAETCLKNAILKPAFHGLVHDPALADAVADLAVSQSGLDRFTEFLNQYVRTAAGIDLEAYARAGSTATLLSELRAVQRMRNGVLHRGETAERLHAMHAIAVASGVLEDIFTAVLASMQFHHHVDWKLCSRMNSCAEPVGAHGTLTPGTAADA